MNTENYIQEKGANNIKLPSMDSVYNNLRYLLSAMTLVIGVSGVMTESTRININVKMVLFAIIILLSGLVLALNSHKNIFQPYKELRITKMAPIRILAHITLTFLWSFGLLMGLIFLYVLVIIFLKV